MTEIAAAGPFYKAEVRFLRLLTCFYSRITTKTTCVLMVPTQTDIAIIVFISDLDLLSINGCHFGFVLAYSSD